MDSRPLLNQVALVTGGGRRLGREIALALARAGASVAVNFNRSKAGAVSTVREIRALGVEAVAFRADIARPAEVRALFRAVAARFRKLDILVNNAGIFFPVRWDSLSEKDWDRVLGTNLKGAFFCAQAAARIMMRRKTGCIVNIASLGGLEAWPDYAHYCSSKAANIMMTRCLAKALAPHIRVNAIAPGTILFPGEKPSRLLLRVIQRTPLARAGRPNEVADLVLFIATRAEFITGQVFAIDGGQSVG